MKGLKRTVAVIALCGRQSAAFQSLRLTPQPSLDLACTNDSMDHRVGLGETPPNRRDIFRMATAASFGSLTAFQSSHQPAAAAVGTLPEFSDTNAIIQGITVNVADKAQQDSMIEFLVNGFDFKILRRRIKDSVEDTVSAMKYIL